MHRHQFPIEGCNTDVRAVYVTCPIHWFEVPAELRARIWNLYRTAKGSPEHLAAIAEAIEAVDGQLAGAPAA
jgi:hypothetical protein